MPPLVLLLAAALAGCVPVRVGTDFSASGRVIDAESGEALAGARVHFLGLFVHPLRSREWQPPESCAELRETDAALLADSAVAAPATDTLRTAVAGAGGAFSLVNERRWSWWLTVPDAFPRGYQSWYRLEVVSGGYEPYRLPVSPACPASLVPPDEIALQPK
ncbi:MAG: hypothetical protein R3362_00400 [Rhodothermales bacterium]|nr:hypothetical protein [Rhodothermales bacterium]